MYRNLKQIIAVVSSDILFKFDFIAIFFFGIGQYWHKTFELFGFFSPQLKFNDGFGAIIHFHTHKGSEERFFLAPNTKVIVSPRSEHKLINYLIPIYHLN